VVSWPPIVVSGSTVADAAVVAVLVAAVLLAVSSALPTDVAGSGPLESPTPLPSTSPPPLHAAPKPASNNNDPIVSRTPIPCASTIARSYTRP
jgi:hypothetical protein